MRVVICCSAKQVGSRRYQRAENFVRKELTDAQLIVPLSVPFPKPKTPDEKDEDMAWTWEQIAESDAVVIVNSYVGASVLMAIGFTISQGKPIFMSSGETDLDEIRALIDCDRVYMLEDIKKTMRKILRVPSKP
jgi:hypothetical protein